MSKVFSRLIKDGKVINARVGMSMDARVMGNGTPVFKGREINNHEALIKARGITLFTGTAKDSDYVSRTTTEQREADEIIGRNNSSGIGTHASIVAKGSGEIKPAEPKERLPEIVSGLKEVAKKLKLIVRSEERKQAANGMDSFLNGVQKPVTRSGIDAYLNSAA
jgi:hypothetical protein